MPNPSLLHPVDPAQSRVDRRVQEFRSLVLETAEALFIEQGVEKTKIDDICRAADVAKRTLCNHFPTKSHIVQELSRDAVSRFVALIDDARSRGASNRERLELLFVSLRDRTLDVSPIHRESVGAFFQVAHESSDGAEGELRLSTALQALLKEGGPEDLPPNASLETFTELILGAIYTTTLEWIHRDDYDLEGRTAALGAFLVGLLPEEPRT
ncbi:MAG: TetR/AcrR family transcriptional regulator [Myxococcota bacterium]